MDCFQGRPGYIDYLGVRKEFQQSVYSEEGKIHFRDDLFFPGIVNLSLETILQEQYRFFLMGLLVVETEFRVAFLHKSYRRYQRKKLRVQYVEEQRLFLLRDRIQLPFLEFERPPLFVLSVFYGQLESMRGQAEIYCQRKDLQPSGMLQNFFCR